MRSVLSPIYSGECQFWEVTAHPLSHSQWKAESRFAIKVVQWKHPGPPLASPSARPKCPSVVSLESEPHVLTWTLELPSHGKAFSMFNCWLLHNFSVYTRTQIQSIWLFYTLECLFAFLINRLTSSHHFCRSKKIWQSQRRKQKTQEWPIHLPLLQHPCSHSPARFCHFEQDNPPPWFHTWRNKMCQSEPEKQPKILRVHPTDPIANNSSGFQ